MELQKLNGKSFQLMGFGFEGQGVVTSWRHGALEEDPAACGHLVVRLAPAAELQRENDVEAGSELAEIVAGKQTILVSVVWRCWSLDPSCLHWNCSSAARGCATK